MRRGNAEFTSVGVHSGYVLRMADLRFRTTLTAIAGCVVLAASAPAVSRPGRAASTAPWDPEPAMAFYEKRLTDGGFTAKVLEQRNFQPSDKLALKAVQGECYQVVVVRETRIAGPYGWDGGA